MKAKSLVIIGVLIGAFLLTMPVAATYDYVAWGGVNTSTYGVVGDSTGVDAKIEGMHFYDLENTGALISLKSFTPRTGWSRGTIPITQNWSYTQATLKNNSGGIISQGTFGYQITQCNCSEDGELYAYYFASNWNANGLTGDLHLNFNFTDTGFISPKIHAFPSSVPQVDAFSTSAGNQHLSATKYELITNTYKVQRYENITTTLPDNSTYDTMMYNRTLNGVVSSSRVILADTDGVFFNGEGTGDIYFPLIFSKPYFLDVLDPEGGWHNYTFWEGFVSGESCNFTAVAQNIANGAAVAGSTFHVWDLTEDTHESFYLPFGSGEASIPHLQHYYAFNATKTGYTGFDAMPPGGVHVTSCAALQAAPIYAQLMGPPVSETNSTLYVYAHDTSEYGLPIAGATIQLGTGQSALTNMAGTTQFNLLILNQSYSYLVSKTGYISVSGNITLDETNEYLDITLTEGTQPTATTTTPGPTQTHPSPQKAATDILQLVADYAYALAAIFLIAILFGGVKLIAK